MAIVTTALEEVAIAIVLLIGLPELDIEPPLWLVALLMISWFGVAILTYRAGTRALKRRHYIGLDGMVGAQGVIVRELKPYGLVNIRGELWAACAETENISEGVDVTVIAQKRIRLTVRRKEQAL